MNDRQTIQIFSVNFDHVPMLRANIELTRARNPNQPHHWHIANNGGDRTAAGIADLVSYGNVSVYDGVEPQPGHKVFASLQHATALNRILHLHAGDDPVLIIDPDFYIVRANGLQDCLAHMAEKHVDILGSPWNPYWRFKYRYFPAVHCCFIRQDRLSASDLDWRPGDYLAHPSDHPEFVTRFLGVPVLGRVLQAVVYQVRNRTLIATDQDTGYRLHRRYVSNPDYHAECLQPVFTRYPDYSPVHRLLDRLLPDRLSFAPKRPGYYTDAGFKAHGLPDMDAHFSEEFMFQGEPFGFHLRLQHQHRRAMQQHPDERPKPEEIDPELESVLNLFVSTS